MPNNYSPMGGGGFCMDMLGGPGVPDIKGTWISKKTGAEVQVRDSIITENGMSVMLSDGRMIDMSEFSNEFYQVSDDFYDMNGNKIKNPQIDIPDYRPDTPLPKPDCPPIDVPGNEIDPGFAYPPKKDNCGCKPGPKPPCPIPPIKPNPDIEGMKTEKRHFDMIGDVFTKVTPTPEIECVARIKKTSKNFPKEQLQMIIDIFGVHIDDIAFYLYKNYFTPEKIMGYLYEYLTDEKKYPDGPQLKDPNKISKPANGENPDSSFGVDSDATNDK